MELRVLRYYLAVAREENITRAAEILHITQPTLSRQMSELEEELHTRLFERTNRKIILTESGLLLRRRAEELVALADKMEQDFLDSGDELTGLISIGTGVSAAVSETLPELLKEYSQNYPQVQFELQVSLLWFRMALSVLQALLLPVSLEQLRLSLLPSVLFHPLASLCFSL